MLRAVDDLRLALDYLSGDAKKEVSHSHALPAARHP